MRTRRSIGVALTALLTGCASTTAGHGQASVSPAADRTPQQQPTGSSAAPSVLPSAPASVPPTSPRTSPGTSSPNSSGAGSPSTGGTPAGFIGRWYGHGRLLTVAPDGAVHLDFRTYVWCTATVTTGCDRMSGNVIHDGGLVDGRISQVINPTTVVVTVTSTSVPATVPEQQFRLGLDLHHDAVAPISGRLRGVPFCGAGAPSGYCGA